MRRFLVLVTLLINDIIIAMMAPFLALLIRFEGSFSSSFYHTVAESVWIMIIARIGFFYAFGLYNRLWRYASIHELILIFIAVTGSSIAIFCGFDVLNIFLPKSIHILNWFFTLALIGTSRITVRLMRYLKARHQKQSSKVLIIGAGDAGVMLAKEIKQRYANKKNVIGYIDDDKYKISQKIMGIEVLGGRDILVASVEKYAVDEIIIAMPSAGGRTISSIVKKCKETKCSVKILPGIYELIDSKISIQQLRNVDVEDLLGREPVLLDIGKIAECIKGKRVMVTGAGGSIGSEICRQVAKLSPAAIYLVGKGENSIFEIHYELSGNYKKCLIQPIIADVRDLERMDALFGELKPQVVFHAAAHKHVPLMEAQPIEAVKNNVFGTRNVAELSLKYDVERFVMISTDKAVNPTSVMGATKRIAELIIQNLNKEGKTIFVAVRFGNVLGSRGSVIPLFKKQIAQGGPVTITHPDMVRYFMTIPEASQLVLQAGTMAQGGEVYVLDMGEPVKILNMACDLIELSGLTPYEDIDIKFTGLRKGEKLFEELLTAEEGSMSTRHNKIFKANLRETPRAFLEEGLIELEKALTNEEIISIFERLIPTYRSAQAGSNEVNRVNDECH